MKIQILGTGCPKCRLLEQHTNDAVKRSSIDATIEKITDLDTMMEMNMMVSPGFAIDGTLIASGRVLSVDQIEQHLRTASREKE